ncbi:hypothetical protein Curi_c25110 [Gottschalkia acidurici 9a]|uniref:GAF domain-containing protein n=1 Tax=Gottschalkia acidurici (strain ATCC 7906 / DSM 604 / BCRC 14475 / CIP 104303 / KCTC 5404 / NCIMB 10678 / 9a) TaxID=1128398 RepID=K0B4M4_GOTA9|nr:GAF domain-containing protein [Gottschalkia acidurici]AFS79506.1 hypothetical protein Curi_c25110 [Gottschalkia acidurici 9a]
MNTKKTIYCVSETILINVIIYFIFFTKQYNQDVYLSLNPHPLLLLCALMGLRYGNQLGLISAVISSIFYTYVFIQIHGDILTLFRYIDNCKYILLFFGSSMVFGSFKDNYDTRLEKALNENKLIKNRYKKLDESYKLTKKIQEELKKQIINSEESILNLYEIASRLETFELEAIYTETIGILSKYLKANTVSVYTYNEKSGYLRLKIRMGDHVEEKSSKQVQESPGLSKVVLEKIPVRWSDVKEEGFALMAAPLVKDGKVIAIVNVENMDFDKLSEYAYQLFRVIIDWVNKSLQKAMYVGELRESPYIDGTEIMEYRSFEERLEEEKRRKRDFGMEYGLLKYRVEDLQLEDVNEKMKKILRDVDIIGYDKLKKVIYILLPATPEDKLKIVEERILSKVSYGLEKIYDKHYEESESSKKALGAEI